jgi:hypothetical protein
MPVKNVSPVAYELYVYDLSNKVKIDALPFSPKPNLTATQYDFQPKSGQEYMWGLSPHQAVEKRRPMEKISPVVQTSSY